MPLVKTVSQLRCPLGLSYWQKKELQNLSAQELRKRNMAWVPKRINHNKNDVHASIATSTMKVKKEKDGRNKQLSQRCASQHQNLRLAHHPFSSTMPLMPLPWNSSTGMISYPSWTYLIHGCNIIFYMMTEYYQITIHLVSYIFVAKTKGPKYFIAILFVYFGYTCFNG